MASPEHRVPPEVRELLLQLAHAHPGPPLDDRDHQLLLVRGAMVLKSLLPTWMEMIGGEAWEGGYTWDEIAHASGHRSSAGAQAIFDARTRRTRRSRAERPTSPPRQGSDVGVPVARAAELLGVSRQTVYRMTEDGRLSWDYGPNGETRITGGHPSLDDTQNGEQPNGR